MSTAPAWLHDLDEVDDDELAAMNAAADADDLAEDDEAADAVPDATSTETTPDSVDPASLPADGTAAPDGPATPDAAADGATDGTQNTPSAANDGQIVQSEAPQHDTDVAAPWTITASKKAHTIDGVTKRADGALVVAASETERVAQIIRRGLEAESTILPQYSEAVKQNRRLARELEETRTAKATREVQMDALFAEFEKMLDDGPHAVAAFLEDYERKRPVLQAKAIEAAANYRIAQMERAQAPDPEEYFEEAERDAVQRVDQLVDHVAKESGLTPEETTGLRTRYRDRLGDFIQQVRQDMPELGLKAGQLALREQRLLAELQYEAGLRTDARSREAQARAAAEKAAQERAAQAAQQNQQQTQADKRNAAVVQAAKPVKTAPNPSQPVAQKTQPKRFADWKTNPLGDDDDDE